MCRDLVRLSKGGPLPNTEPTTGYFPYLKTLLVQGSRHSLIRYKLRLSARSWFIDVNTLMNMLVVRIVLVHVQAFS